MEWNLVRLAGKIWLMGKSKALAMEHVAKKMGSEKKKGRFTNLFSLGEKQWFVDAELLGTLEEMTIGAVHLDGKQVASFLSKEKEEQDREARKLLEKKQNPWRYLDVILTITLVALFGILLLR